MEARPAQLTGSTEILDLAASRTIDITGLRTLDETIHLSFDVDDRGAVWLYQFGWLRGRQETQVFALEPVTARPSVCPIPEALQRLPFSVFCAGAGRIYLLGCPAPSAGAPTGFALDPAGRIVGAFHLRGELLDAAIDPSGGLWIASRESALPEQRLGLQFLSLEDDVAPRIPLDDWSGGQISCLARVDARILLGGTDSAGFTRIQIVTRDARTDVKCEDIGLPRALGVGPHGNLLCLGAGGRLMRVGEATSTELRLVEPSSGPLRGIDSLRFAYRRIFALAAKRDRILEFNL